MGLEELPPSSRASGRGLRVAFATLGCKVNQYDTATMETLVGRDACTVVPFARGADVYVVNSCTVTDRADAESCQLARRAKRLNPHARVILTGCFAQVSPESAARVSGVDYVVGMGRLPDLLRAVRDEIPDAEDRILVGDIRKADRVDAWGAEMFRGRTRAFLKVQEGCDLFCTFCIVPLARGRSRSVEPRRVLAELRRLAERGFREVVLSGVHLGSYGRDLSPAMSLVDLVEMIAEVAPVPRVRLSSIDPPEIAPRLLELVARSKVLCPHFHVPVQSGADSVLRRMGRKYDAALIRDAVGEIARVLPHAGIGTDVIAGFPGESDAEFATGIELLQGAPFTYFHVFPYSRRRGTTAAKARDAVPAGTVVARARALRRLGTVKRRGFVERFIGADLSVLVEERREPESNNLVGYSSNYVRVLLAGPDTLMNSEAVVRGMERRGDRLFGAAVSAANGHGAAVGD